MALVPCRECGSDVSTSAATCPRCGVPSPAEMSAHVRIVRSGGTATDLIAGVGDDDVHEIFADAPVTIDLLPGEHLLGVQWGDDGIVEFPFKIGHGQDLTATVTFGGGVDFR